MHDIKEGGKAYAFGPRNALCSKYLVVVDGLGNKHTMQMQVRGTDGGVKVEEGREGVSLPPTPLLACPWSLLTAARM